MGTLRLLSLLTSMTLVFAFGCKDDRPAQRPADEDIGSPYADAADAGADDDATVVPDSTVPDANLGGPNCEIEFRAEDGSATHHCEIPVRSMMGCDALALCLCEAEAAVTPDIIDIEACTASMLVPRGAITFSDLCTLSGAAGAEPLPEMLGAAGEVDGIFWLQRANQQMVLSESCGELADFTLWGESPSLELSVGVYGEPEAPISYTVAEELLEPTPLLTLDNIGMFTRETAEFMAFDPDIPTNVVEAFDDPLAGRFFVLHKDRRVLVSGSMVTMVMSSSREGPAIVVEDLAQTGYSVFRIDDGYPARGPLVDSFDMDRMRANVAAVGKLVDAACISTCGCMIGQGCRRGVCERLGGCSTDADCCLKSCVGGTCVEP